jgi:hypothetical protein
VVTPHQLPAGIEVALGFRLRLVISIAGSLRRAGEVK